MITFTRGDKKFNYRVAGIFIRDGCVLLHRAETEPFWTLPGGRCELMESGGVALVREMQEELSVRVRVERLVWLAESFFQYEGLDCHEIGMYFQAHLPHDALRYAVGEVFLGDEAGMTLLFRWFDLAELPGLYVLPRFLGRGLPALPDTMQYVVDTEGL